MLVVDFGIGMILVILIIITIIMMFFFWLFFSLFCFFVNFFFVEFIKYVCGLRRMCCGGGVARYVECTNVVKK